MCSNFQSITPPQADWVRDQFQCELPEAIWRDEVYPGYQAPFIWREGEHLRCELAQFGLVPCWAVDDKAFGRRTYNARSETVADKPSYRHAWKHRQFGVAIMQGFYEPNYATGKAVRWRISRADAAPMAVASIWERCVDKATGELVFSFSLLTVNASGHPVMQQFHQPDDEKRSIVVLQASDYNNWLYANQEQARDLLALAPDDFLKSVPAPR
ncbi:MAG: SOS response-associated peptidase family protein [Dehalococcoidia bacterium]|nr:SOS response-associated peptidase family protein [Dehalococcoidia bacterium]